MYSLNPHVASNLYDSLSFIKHKMIYFAECLSCSLEVDPGAIKNNDNNKINKQIRSNKKKFKKETKHHKMKSNIIKLQKETIKYNKK